MSIVIPKNLKPHENSGWFESLSLKEKQEFVESQNPNVRRFKSVIRAQAEKYGDYYWAYRLDNGWQYGCSSSQEETCAKLKNFLSQKG